LGAEAAVNGRTDDLRYGDSPRRDGSTSWLTPLPLWSGILAGPVAWALDLTVGYAIVHWTCNNQRAAVLRAITPAALLLVGLGAVASYVALQRTEGDEPTDGGRPRQRARFMALLGLTLCAFFALTIVALAIPKWVLDVCD
jgi:hypothetical protein